ncbi:uncharacterized protein RBU33_019197 isoform 1-T1 [Hipposideros larvatus]
MLGGVVCGPDPPRSGSEAWLDVCSCPISAFLASCCVTSVSDGEKKQLSHHLQKPPRFLIQTPAWNEISELWEGVEGGKKGGVGFPLSSVPPGPQPSALTSTEQFGYRPQRGLQQRVQALQFPQSTENLRPGACQENRSSWWPRQDGAPGLMCTRWHPSQFAKRPLPARSASTL